MAEVKGENRSNIDAEPSVKIDSALNKARVRMIYDKYTSVGVLAIGDDILMGEEIPAGAKILDVWVKHDDFGTTGDFDIGYNASADGGEAEDEDAFFAALDVNAAAGHSKMSDTDATVAGLGKVLSEPVQAKIVPTEATTATGADVEMWILYTLD